MAQLTLFDSGEKLLVDDERGRITYILEVIDAATAAEWFDELRAAVQWRSERRLMYEREVDVPRLMAHYRLDPPPASTPPALVNRCVRQLVLPNLRPANRTTFLVSQVRWEGYRAQASELEGKPKRVCNAPHRAAFVKPPETVEKSGWAGAVRCIDGDIGMFRSRHESAARPGDDRA